MISHAPPISDVYTTDGQLVFTGTTITDGQGVWQSIGGQEVGTVWGHGAYVAPDWSADWLHRESEILLDIWAVRAGARNFADPGPDQQAVFKARLIREMRTNTYDGVRNRVTIDEDRATAFQLKLPQQIVELPAGHLLALDRCVTHDVEAVEESVFLLTICWPENAA